MVDAPCVVKVVPYNEEPDSYGDLMAVNFGNQDSPTVLPLIRMKCGTILVVSAPATDATNEMTLEPSVHR